MDLIRRPARAAGLALGLVLLAPALGLIPAALVDRGPEGTVRPTVFPLGLAVFDPFVRACARNSLAGSAVVTAGSLVLGVGLARVLVGWRFWGRRPLAALVLAPLVVSPLFGALGLRAALGREPGGGVLDWLCWVWAETTCGTALVALATASVLGRMEPAWIDAARLAGATRSRIWWQLTWPIVRPEALRCAATVFTLTLVEPGAALVLGLRRTLAFQVVEAAVGADPWPRAAVLAALAVALALVGRGLLHRLGGRPQDLASEVPVARAEAAEWPRATAYVLALAAGAAFAWLPLAALVVSGLTPAGADPSSRLELSGSEFLRRLDHPQVRELLVNSLVLGLATVVLSLFLARSLGGLARRRRLVKVLTDWPDALPPLSIGVGALALPWLVRLAADGLRPGGGSGPLIRGLVALAGAIDPERAPGVLLVLAVAAARQASLVRVAERVRRRSEGAQIDAATHLGASHRAARSAASAGWFGVPAGALVLTLALAATNLAPALVLAPTLASGPAAPAILILADQPGDARSRAAALSACLVLINVSALALAARQRDGWLADWFRGG